MEYLFLSLATIEDIKYKKISNTILIIGGALGIFSLVSNLPSLKWECILALVPGMLMIILAYLSKEKIGYGDGICVLFIGMMEGYRKCVILVLLSLGLLFLFCVIALILKKVKKETRIPFLPFLLCGRIILGVAAI